MKYMIIVLKVKNKWKGGEMGIIYLKIIKY